jgi:hypothetical protein
VVVVLPEVEFGFDESVVDELINGECWSLASVLHHRSGLPFAALYGDGEIVHVGVELADGTVVDIEGIWDSCSWESHWVEILDDVWEIYSGFVTDDLEDREALLGYSPSLELVCMGDEGDTLGSIADRIMEQVLAYQEKSPLTSGI